MVDILWSGQTVLAALYEKYAEKYGEEDELLKQARCQKNLEKRRKISCVGGSKEGAFLILGPIIMCILLFRFFWQKSLNTVFLYYYIKSTESTFLCLIVPFVQQTFPCLWIALSNEYLVEKLKQSGHSKKHFYIFIFIFCT